MKNFLLLFKRHFLMLLVIIIFAVCGTIYFFTRNIPTTNDAFVIARIRPVASRVDGYINAIDVSDDEHVKKGQLLLTLDPKPYEIALSKAQNMLENGKNAVKAMKLQLQINKQIIAEKKLTYQTDKFNYENAQKLFQKNAFAKVKVDNLMRQMEISYAAYQTATLNMELNQAAITEAVLNVKKLYLDVQEQKLLLSYTKIYATTPGIINNLNISVGTFVTAGNPLFAFIDTSRWWVQANLKETQLSKVKMGDKVDFTLRMYPNKRFHGVIENMGWAVQRQLTDTQTFLAKVINENQWFLLPQRFPVIIRITSKPDENYPFHVGASAYVKIRTQS